jgi:hypothetical protein
MCSLAATLAEDLFTAGRLTGATVNQEETLAIRGARDVEALLDRLATLEVTAAPGAGGSGLSSPHEKTFPGSAGATSATQGRAEVITFAPEGPRGVCAYAGGKKTAAA